MNKTQQLNLPNLLVQLQLLEKQKDEQHRKYSPREEKILYFQELEKQKRELRNQRMKQMQKQMGLVKNHRKVSSLDGKQMARLNIITQLEKYRQYLSTQTPQIEDDQFYLGSDYCPIENHDLFSLEDDQGSLYEQKKYKAMKTLKKYKINKTRANSKISQLPEKPPTPPIVIQVDKPKVIHLQSKSQQMYDDYLNTDVYNVQFGYRDKLKPEKEEKTTEVKLKEILNRLGIQLNKFKPISRKEVDSALDLIKKEEIQEISSITSNKDIEVRKPRKRVSQVIEHRISLLYPKKISVPSRYSQSTSMHSSEIQSRAIYRRCSQKEQPSPTMKKARAIGQLHQICNKLNAEIMESRTFSKDGLKAITQLDNLVSEPLLKFFPTFDLNIIK